MCMFPRLRTVVGQSHLLVGPSSPPHDLTCTDWWATQGKNHCHSEPRLEMDQLFIGRSEKPKYVSRGICD